MTRFDPEPRSSGPAIVRGGPEGYATLLVLDPAGAAKHEDIPASWNTLLRSRHVVWARLPTRQALAEAEDTLASLTESAATVDVLTSGPTAELAMDFAFQRAEAIRALLLVDPGAPDQRFSAQEAEYADALWEERAQDRISALEDAGVLVRVVAHSSGGSRDRVRPPLPLGHPDIVPTISGVIGELDAAGTVQG